VTFRAKTRADADLVDNCAWNVLKQSV